MIFNGLERQHIWLLSMLVAAAPIYLSRKIRKKMAGFGAGFRRAVFVPLFVP